LFVAALGSNSVEVIDLLANKLIKHIDGFHEPQGIAYVAQTNRLFVANGGDGSVVVLECEKFTRVGKIDLKRTPTVCAMTRPRNGSSSATARARSHRGRLHAPTYQRHQTARSSRILPTRTPRHARLRQRARANHVAVVDKDTEKTVTTWPLDSVGARGNFPMALDEETRLLYVAFRRRGGSLFSN